MSDDSDMCPPCADPSGGGSGSVWTIVVAGGAGSRFGSRKQFVDLAGESVVQRSIDAAVTVSAGVVAVLPRDAIDEHDLHTPSGVELVVVPGGRTRAESVRAGLAALPSSCATVLVHDAARPLASRSLFERVAERAAAGADAVVPTVPLTDTIRRVAGGVVDRSTLLAVQTPQGFPADVLRRAHTGGGEATDDATLVESVGGTVVVVDGEAENRKITDPVDLVAALALLERNGNTP